MRVILVSLLLSGCTHREPLPKDTKFDPSKRDWASIYLMEIHRAKDNDDPDAMIFFLFEYQDELKRLEEQKVLD